MFGLGSEGRSEHRALQHRRHPGAARRAREGAHRQPSAHLRRRRRPARSRACGRAATTGPGRRRRRTTNQCHDITVFPEVGLAAGACSGNGILLDISDPVHPVRLDQVVDKNFAYWHSATFNNDGTKVIFTDEWGGGTRPRCRATDLPNWGADAIFDIVDRKLKFASYYKMPAAQTDQENCVAHNGSIDAGARTRHHGAGVVSGRRVGVRLHRLRQAGRDRLLRSRPDRRHESDPRRLLVGLLVQRPHLRLGDRPRSRRVQAARPANSCRRTRSTPPPLIHLDEFNAQLQPRLSWAATPAVARAYLAQLTRNNALPADRAAAVKTALEHRDKAKLEQLAGQLEQSAASATGQDATRLRSLATTLKGVAAPK